MNQEEIELIKQMVIHGIYEVCLMNGYGYDTFEKFKNKQDLLFANYTLNKAQLELRNSIDKFNDLYLK